MLNVLTLIDGTNKKLFLPPFFKGKTHPMQSELKWKKTMFELAYVQRILYLIFTSDGLEYVRQCVAETTQ